MSGRGEPDGQAAPARRDTAGTMTCHQCGISIPYVTYGHTLPNSGDQDRMNIVCAPYSSLPFGHSSQLDHRLISCSWELMSCLGQGGMSNGLATNQCLYMCMRQHRASEAGWL